MRGRRRSFLPDRLVQLRLNIAEAHAQVPETDGLESELPDAHLNVIGARQRLEAHGVHDQPQGHAQGPPPQEELPLLKEGPLGENVYLRASWKPDHLLHQAGDLRGACHRCTSRWRWTSRTCRWSGTDLKACNLEYQILELVNHQAQSHSTSGVEHGVHWPQEGTHCGLEEEGLGQRGEQQQQGVAAGHDASDPTVHEQTPKGILDVAVGRQARLVVIEKVCVETCQSLSSGPQGWAHACACKVIVAHPRPQQGHPQEEKQADVHNDDSQRLHARMASINLLEGPLIALQAWVGLQADALLAEHLVGLDAKAGHSCCAAA